MKKLQQGERVFAIVPEMFKTSGFYNEPLWVYIEDMAGHRRVECFQPEEQTVGMRTLFKTFATSYDAMKREVVIKLNKNENIESTNRLRRAAPKSPHRVR